MESKPKSRLKKVGLFAAGAIVLMALYLIAGLLLYGMVWVSSKAIPWLIDASVIALGICLFVLVPLYIFRKTRPWAGFGFYIASYAFGTLLFAYSCLFAYYVWGIAGLLVGLLFLGVGVVPVALVAALLHARWAVLLALTVGIIFTFGLRFLGIWLVKPTEEKEDEEEEQSAVLTGPPLPLGLESPYQDDPLQPYDILERECEVQRSSAIMNKSERAKLYLDYLTEEGFRPSIDSDGDVTFKVEGEQYHILIDEEQEDYFDLYCFLWKIKDEDVASSITAANLVTLHTRVAKVCVHTYGEMKYVTASAQMFISPPDGFRNVFTRALSVLRYAVKSFTEKMTADAAHAA